jgi:hypothetical protein
MSNQPDLSYITPDLRYLAKPIDQFVPDPANARTHGRKNKRAISGSLEEFTQRTPIVVRRDGMVISKGNGTWEQARALGWTHIAAVVCDDDEARAAAYALADNRSGDLSKWSKDNLAATLRKLRDAQVPLARIGFTPEDVEKRLSAQVPGASDPSEMLARFSPEDRALLEGMAGYRTAQARVGPSVPMAWFKTGGYLRGKILDYGCGRDVPPSSVDLARYDPAYFPDLDVLTKQYDTITLNYVLNVIPLEAHRVQVLLSLRALLKPGGMVLVSVYRKGDQDTRSTAGYQCGWSPDQWERFLARWYEVERVPSSAGFLGWRCTPRRLVGRIPGKVIGGRRYFHRSALDLQEPKYRDAIAQAERYCSGWEWTVARVDLNAEQVTLVKSFDWDTAPEPAVGPFCTVDLTGTMQARISEASGLIYHHKWMFVADDYEGFDVEESKARSAAWEALPNVDKSRIGQRQYWEERVLPRLGKRESAMFSGFE